MECRDRGPVERLTTIRQQGQSARSEISSDMRAFEKTLHEIEEL